ncbi:MAG: multiple sugar transport system permease protein, partial [Verrucomicrobiota bacterium]
MSAWKFFAAAVLLGIALWFLSPTRPIRPNEPGVVEISYLGQSGAEAAAVADAFRIFESESRAAHERDPSHPIYRIVTGQNASRDQTADPTRFLVSVAGGAPPDLIRFDRYAISEWAARGAFARLNQFVRRDEASNDPNAVRPENFYRACWEEVVYEHPLTHERGIYAVPADVDDRALFYNKDILKRGGYVDLAGEARPPRTWEELEEMATRLTERDARGAITQLGFAPNFGNAWLYLYSWMNGGEFLSGDRTRCTLASAPVVRALEWMTRMYDRVGGARAVYAFQGNSQAGQLNVAPGQLDWFVQGKVAMKIDGYWCFPEVLAQFGRDLNYAVAPPPLPAREVAVGRKGFGWVSGWCFAIPSTAQHKEAAWELLRFMCSRRAREIIGESEQQRLQSLGRVYVPMQNANRRINEWQFEKYIAHNPAIQSKVRDGAKLLNDLLETSPIRPVTPVGQLLFNEQRRATENAIFHKMSAEDGLKQSEQIVQKQLDRLLHPPQGPLVSWKYFLAIYAALVALATLSIFAWEKRKIDISPSGHWREGWIAASPWLIGFIVFTGGPILFSIVISFCDYDILNPARFIGLTNYRSMVSDDALFWKSIGNTAFMIIGIPLGMALSLALALLLNLEVRSVAIWRTLFFLPSIVPAVASSILWIWIFNPNIGLMNQVLAAFGIHGPNWLQDEQTSKPALIIMGLWSAGGGMIVWLAGLKGINREYYEAAMLDGANAWQRFSRITLPLLTPYILFNLIIGM